MFNLFPHLQMQWELVRRNPMVNLYTPPPPWKTLVILNITLFYALFFCEI